jgi:hypothetical protein
MEAQTAYMQLAAGLEAVLTGVSSSMGHSTSYVEDSAGIRFEFVVLCSHGIKKEFEAPYLALLGIKQFIGDASLNWSLL